MSAPSAERAVSIGGGPAAVVLNWNSVAGADKYRVYIGSSPGAQNRYVQTPNADTQFIYRGGGEVWSSPPATGKLWNVKNLLELKNAQRVLIDGNVFEHLWPASQQGYAILFTPRNDDGNAPWSVVRDISFTNNILRHVSGGLNILGEDDVRSSQHTERITIRNNLVYDMSAAWGGASHFMVMSRGPSDVTVDHNTIFHEGMVVLVDDGAVSGFRFTNNVMPHNTYGIFGSSAGTGIDAINAYFPGAVVTRNAFGGGPASVYPRRQLLSGSPRLHGAIRERGRRRLQAGHRKYVQRRRYGRQGSRNRLRWTCCGNGGAGQRRRRDGRGIFRRWHSDCDTRYFAGRGFR